MKKGQLIVLSIITLVAISCSEKSSSDTYLNIEPNTLTFTAEGGNANFSISSNTDWSITTDNENIQISPRSGKGDQNIQVNVPSSTDIQQKEIRLMIKTNDGSVVRNLTIIQEGYLLTGGTLKVTNHSNYLIFNGVANDIDSLVILSNGPWELRGPEWIEAYNGNRWLALSPTRAVISGNAMIESSEARSTTILIRTASANDQELELNDLLTVSQPYSGDMKVEITVVQLGKHAVASNMYVPLATGIATDWKCGSSVKKILSRLFEYELSETELETELNADNIDSWLVSAPEEIVSWSDLQENTSYWLYTLGLDSDGLYHFTYHIQVSTASSENQAIASFKNVNYDGTKWYFEIDMNEYCKGFFLWKMMNPDTFYFSDEIIAWFFSYRMHDNELTKEHPMYRTFEHGEITTDNHIQLITWGVGQDGVRMSGVISRYRSIDYYETRGLGHNEDAPRSMSVPKDILFSEKSFIKIK